MAENFSQEYIVKVFVEVEPDEVEPNDFEKVKLFGEFIEVVISEGLVNDLEVSPEYFTVEVTPK